MTQSMDHSFTVAEEKKLFATVRKFKALEAQRDLYWMMLLRYTGRRVQTITMFDEQDALLAVDKGYMDIASHMQKGGKPDSKRQLDKSQEIFLVSSAKDALLGLVKVRRQMIKRASNHNIDSAALILSRTCQRISVRTLQHRMTYWCEQAGVVSGTPHWWRHTWAVRRMQNAEGNNDKALREVQAVLGHKYITTTQIYTQPNRDDLKNSMLEASL